MSQQELTLPRSALLQKSTTELLDAFGAGNASPGSGSAAALMGLLSAKLIITACAKSIQKSKDKSADRSYQYIADQISQEIEPKLKELFERDAQDFDQVVRLRKQRDASSDSTEKSVFSRRANDLLESATDCTIEITDLCMKLIDHGIFVFNNGWPAIRGDSGAAISAAIAGVMSGIFVINLNLKTLKDRKYAGQNLQKCNDLYTNLQSKQTSAFTCVTSLNQEAVEAIQLELGGINISVSD